MKVLIDMNLTPKWCQTLRLGGHQAVHWSEVGDPGATDRRIMQWAAANGFIVFTHDLDFGALLAASQADGPSVVQVRTEDVMPEHLGQTILGVMGEHKASLDSGAIVVVEEQRSRVRILPLP